jgi:hypothetical protein
MNPFAPGEDVHQIIRQGTEQLVRQALTVKHGPHALIEAPISPQITLTHTVPQDYRQGIEQARSVEMQARALVHNYARKARGEGVPWSDLAGPLGIVLDPDEDYGVDPAARAFEEIAGRPSQRFDPLHVYWTCTACGAHVDDRGPYNGHPSDDEHGHAETCTRLAADIAAYRARHGLDDDDD